MLKAANNKLAGFEHLNHQEWEEPFFFVQAADSQIGLMVQVKETEDGETALPPGMEGLAHLRVFNAEEYDKIETEEDLPGFEE